MRAEAKSLSSLMVMLAALSTDQTLAGHSNDHIFGSGFETLPYPPVVTLLVLGSDLEPGDAVVVLWTSVGATDCVASSSGPTPITWTGSRPTSGSDESITLSASGTYELRLQCFQGAQSSIVAAVAVTPIERACRHSADPAASGFSLTAFDLPWQQAFWLNAGGYPDGGAQPVALGMRRSTYTTVSIEAQPSSTVELTTSLAMPPPQEGGYSFGAPASSTLVSISPCRGDLRAVNNVADDPFQRAACRRFAPGATFFYSTVPALGPDVCSLVPGATYYLNFAAVDPANPSPGTCPSGASAGCDVLVTHKPIEP